MINVNSVQPPSEIYNGENIPTGGIKMPPTQIRVKRYRVMR